MTESEPRPTATHQRSPNYPASALPEMIEDVRKIFTKEKRTLLTPESLVSAMGYTTLSGRARTKMASLRKYGLIDDVGQKSQVSQLAMRILHQPETSADYLAALREAALKPEQFANFYKSHRDASEESIRSELILQGGFSPEGARLFAKAFRETITFAKLNEVDYSPPDGENKNESESKRNGDDPPLGKKSMNPSVLAEWSFPVGQNEATIRFAGSGDLVAEDFDALTDYIEIFKKQYERKKEAKNLAHNLRDLIQ